MKINARGMQCPLPVIEAKKALKSCPKEEEIEVMVDNEIAVQNLTKMAVQMQIDYRVVSLNEHDFTVTLIRDVTPYLEQDEKEEKLQSIHDEKEVEPLANGILKGCVLVVSSDKMGDGDEELGKQLMKGFLYAQTQLDHLPETIIFYNSGAKLTTEGSDSLEDLKQLQEKGVEIVTCGLCLNYYQLTEKLQVGTITNMYVISEKMAMAKKIIKP